MTRPYHVYPQSLSDPLASDAIWVGQDSAHYYAACSYVGPLYKSTVACLDPTTGAKLHDVVDIEGQPDSIISDGSGGIYVAGRLTHVDGVNTPGKAVVHVHSDGTLDDTFNLRFAGSMGQYYRDPYVADMALLGGTLYLGGLGLCSLNGTYLHGTSLCAVNATTGAKVAWDPFTSPVTFSAGTTDFASYADPEVSYVITDGTSIFVSGQFIVVSNGITHNNFLKIDPITAVIDDTWVPDSTVLSTTMAFWGTAPTDHLVVVKGTTISTLNHVTGASGGVLVSGLSFGGESASIAADTTANIVYVHAQFTGSFILKLVSSTGWSVVTPAGGNVAIDPSGTHLYLGNVKYLAADGSVVGAWVPVANTSWSSSAVDGSAFWGCDRDLTTLTKTSRHALAQINKVDGTLTSWNPNVVAKGTSTFTAYGGFDVVEGTFYAVGDASNQSLYAIDTSTGTFTNYVTSISSSIGFVTAAGADVYIGGSFTTVNGVAHTKIAKFTSGVLSAWVPTTLITVNVEALKVSPDGAKLFYGYNHGVVCLDTTTGNQLWSVVTAETGESFGGDVSVFGFSPDQTKLYVGGSFDTVHGTVGRVGLARLDAATGALDSWNPNVFSASVFFTPFAIETVGDYVYWGGWYVLGANGILRNGAMCVKASDASWTSSWDPPHTGNDGGWVYSIAADAATGRLLTASTEVATLNKRRASNLQFHSGTPDDPGGPDLTTPIVPGAIAQTKTFASTGDTSTFTVTLDQPLTRGGTLFLFLVFSNQNVRLPAIDFEAGSGEVFADSGQFGSQDNLSTGVPWNHTTNPGFLTYETAMFFAAGTAEEDGTQEPEAPQVLTIKWNVACSVVCSMVEVTGLNTDYYDSQFGVVKMTNTSSGTVDPSTSPYGSIGNKIVSIWGVATDGATVYSGLTSTHMSYTVLAQVASTGGSGDVALQVLYDTTTTMGSTDFIDFSASISPSRRWAAIHWGLDHLDAGDAV